MERMNPPERTAVDWSPFNFGCIAGAAPWIVVLSYFLGGGNFGEIPGFVYGILFGYFLFFNTFPVNMALQYGRITGLASWSTSCCPLCRKACWHGLSSGALFSP